MPTAKNGTPPLARQGSDGAGLFGRGQYRQDTKSPQTTEGVPARWTLQDLVELKARHGGLVYNGGRDWIGPGPGHGRADRSLHVTVTADGKPVWHSFASDPAAAVWDHLGLTGGTFFGSNRRPPRRPPVWPAAAYVSIEPWKIQWCERVWGEAVDPHGTVVEAHLQSRAIFGPIPSAIRFHPYGPRTYSRSGNCPAMVARVVNATGDMVGLHLTYLAPDGRRKAYYGGSRRMFGSVTGGAVRLGPFVDGVFAVAEGIETALSFSALTGISTWAALSQGGVRSFGIPPNIDLLVIAADGDAAGRTAGAELASRTDNGALAHIASAPDGWDWNDVLRGGRL